jgi:hypothetical protein
MFETVTLAFGITAPLESVTVPTIMADSCCWHLAVIDNAKKTEAKSRIALFIRIPLRRGIIGFSRPRELVTNPNEHYLLFEKLLVAGHGFLYGRDRLCKWTAKVMAF